MERQLFVGHLRGKTARQKKAIDVWLEAHPYKKACLFDSKTDRRETRWFEPRLLLKEGRKDGST
jgi:hypothetical protein